MILYKFIKNKNENTKSIIKYNEHNLKIAQFQNIYKYFK